MVTSWKEALLFALYSTNDTVGKRLAELGVLKSDSMFSLILTI